MSPLSTALKDGVAKCKPATKDATVAIEVEAIKTKTDFIEFEKVGWLKYFLRGEDPPPWVSALDLSQEFIEGSLFAGGNLSAAGNCVGLAGSLVNAVGVTNYPREVVNHFLTLAPCRWYCAVAGTTGARGDNCDSIVVNSVAAPVVTLSSVVPEFAFARVASAELLDSNCALNFSNQEVKFGASGEVRDLV